MPYTPKKRSSSSSHLIIGAAVFAVLIAGAAFSLYAAMHRVQLQNQAFNNNYESVCTTDDSAAAECGGDTDCVATDKCRPIDPNNQNSKKVCWLTGCEVPGALGSKCSDRCTVASVTPSSTAPTIVDDGTMRCSVSFHAVVK
jgi:hypothetical protein